MGIALHIIAVGTKMPAWVTDAYQEYAKRFTRDFPLSLTEIPLGKTNKIIDYLTPKSRTIALDIKGEAWDTEKLAKQLDHSQNICAVLNFLIGGPDGLNKECLAAAHHRWSLSPLTFPHPLVRIILVEQLYRAMSILNHHPYHRT